jgi:hypothetical protein
LPEVFRSELLPNICRRQTGAAAGRMPCMYDKKKEFKHIEAHMVLFCIFFALSVLSFPAIPAAVAMFNKFTEVPDTDSAFAMAGLVPAVLSIFVLIFSIAIFSIFSCISLYSAITLLSSDTKHIIWMAPYSAVVITIGILRTVIN